MLLLSSFISNAAILSGLLTLSLTSSNSPGIIESAFSACSSEKAIFSAALSPNESTSCLNSPALSPAPARSPAAMRLSYSLFILLNLLEGKAESASFNCFNKDFLNVSLAPSLSSLREFFNLSKGTSASLA